MNGAVASALAAVPMLLWVSRAHVLVRPTTHGLRGVFRFGGTLTPARLAEELSEKSPDFIVTALLGFHAGGVWGKAGTLLTSFQDFVTTGMSKVATPVLARLGGGGAPDAAGVASFDALWPAFERASQMLFLLQCSFFAWLLVCAPEVVAVLLGPQWTEAVVVVQAGAVGGMLWAVPASAWRWPPCCCRARCWCARRRHCGCCGPRWALVRGGCCGRWGHRRGWRWRLGG